MGREDYDGPDEFMDDPEEREDVWAQELRDGGIWWVDAIDTIEDPERRQVLMERAKELLEERKELLRGSESGEIDDFEFWARNWELRKKFSKEAFKAHLESVFPAPGELGELSEEYDNMTTGDPKWIEINDRLNAFIKNNPDYAQEEADRQFEEGEIGQEAYDLISEKVKRYRRAK